MIFTKHPPHGGRSARAALPLSVCSTATLGPAVDERTETSASEQVSTDTPWQVVVWDDPVNLMSWVTWVFRTYFGFPQSKAHTLMMAVHTDGRAVVTSGTLEEAEKHVAALHGYGLWATYERAGGQNDGNAGGNQEGRH
ncbi:ATP-dependent Clp protease adapter ClpS [Kocuria sp. JC486]|uniref:ATP-dependent Clp protease adapter protein ClpS n=2 Tax=Kocuria subflava TaxID=1736139 RepID=A0A846U0J0_9MICC|nr:MULTISPECIES: ATP-dependent Clp protease adapter ClpS [Kocuria]NHU84571.1 ATP-dependent Clp protease adapter ClpS [Kocuria sp. JC486]NKE10957.1 ATP-dependent Clp protease adapter ClpS [Kocuria subflava]